MTVQNLYTQYLDGKITKQKFLYEVRRDQNLTMISPNNSFDDVVRILKNKSIISEKAHKESTGKQEVDIIAKTIDMVNPYEYTKGMEYELDIIDVPVTSGDLSEENVAKAQKKVLTNLTKNPRYYTEKICGKGEVSEEWVEATKKEIDKIGKGKPKVIREGLEEAADTEADKDMVRKLMAMYEAEPSKFEKLYKQAQVQADTTKEIKFKHLLSLFDRAKAGALQSLANQDRFDADREGMDEMVRPGYHPDGTPKSNEEMSDDEREAFYNDSDFLDEGGNLGHNELSSIHQEGAYWIVTYRGPKGTTEKSFTSEKEARKFQDGLNEHGQYADRVADVNADSSPLKEEAIYEKYAQKMGKTVDEIKAMVKEAKAKKLEEADDTPEEKKAKDLEIAAEKAKIAASNKKIQDLNQGR